MKWIQGLERRYRHLAVQNLMTYIVFLNAIVYLMMLFEPRYVSALILIPSLVLRGEIWRVVTFLFIPPTTSMIFIFFVLYFYYMVGSSLEQTWGSFRFNLYYLIGVLASIAGAFLSGLGVTSVYLNLSLFLAFARLFPEFQILLFLMIPVKVKYLAYLNWFFIGYTVLFSPFPHKIAALASLVNFFLFFGPDLISSLKRREKVMKNRKRFAEGLKTKGGGAFHSCRVCGITEREDPKMEFRYCSKCSGDYEYCMDHLYDHKHQ